MMDEWTDRAVPAGAAFGVGDLPIAAIAHEAGIAGPRPHSRTSLDQEWNEIAGALLARGPSA
jgi:hypothetical protein